MATMTESDGPVAIEIGGRTLKLHRLKIRDYLDWLADLHKERKEAFIRLIPAGIIAIERYKILRNIEIDEPSPDDIVPLLYTAKGQIKVLELALTKTMDEKEVAKVIDDMEAHQTKRAAFELSGLFTVNQLSEIFLPSPPVQLTAQGNGGQMQQAFGSAGGVPLAASSPVAG